VDGVRQGTRKLKERTLKRAKPLKGEEPVQELVTEPVTEPVTEEAPSKSSRVSATYRKLVDGVRQGTQKLKERAFKRAKPLKGEVPIEVPSEEPVTEVAPSKSSRVSATYRNLVDRLRQGTQTLKDRTLGKPNSSVAEPSSKQTVTEEAQPKSSRVSATYQELVDRIRKAKQRYRSEPAGGASESPTAGSASKVKKPLYRRAGESRRKRLVESIWRSKRSGETGSETDSPPAKPRITGGSSTGEPVAPGAVDDAFQLPR